MSFFDEIGKKVSQVGSDTAKMTKDFSDTAKLNSAINSAESALNSLYIQIGRMFYERNSANPPEVFTDIFNAVGEQNEIIERSREQIRLIKGLIKCESCGMEVSKNSAFCPTCGGKLPKFIPAGMCECVGCGNLIEITSKFCTKCGNPNNRINTDEQTSVTENVEQ